MSMAVAEILQNLNVLSKQFSSFDDNWVHLKTDHEFALDVKHDSPIRRMYEEGRTYTSSLKGRLETKYVNQSMLLDEYVKYVRGAIPSSKPSYDAIGQAAQADYEKNYPTNYTVKYMLDQYWDQWDAIQRVNQFLELLIKTSAYQPLVTSIPMDVIRQYSKNNWEQNSQLHLDHGENALRAQLVVALRNAGFTASAETYASQGRTDILVLKPSVAGILDNSNLLIAECKIWDGPTALYAALSQLCQYVTPNDAHAALIVFVNKGDFAQICSKAATCLGEHPAFKASSGGTDHIEFSLKPAQNKSLVIPATLLLCNLTTPRYSREKQRDGAETTGIVDLFETDKRLMLKPVMDFNTFLRSAFADGPCTCIRCKENDGSEAGYQYKHTFDLDGHLVNRRFAATTHADVFFALRKAWLSYTKLEMENSGVLDLEVVKEFVSPELHVRLVPLLVACGLVSETREVLQLQVQQTE